VSTGGTHDIGIWQAGDGLTKDLAGLIAGVKGAVGKTIPY
jgi:hypothetical protein